MSRSPDLATRLSLHATTEPDRSLVRRLESELGASGRRERQSVLLRRLVGQRGHEALQELFADRVGPAKRFAAGALGRTEPTEGLAVSLFEVSLAGRPKVLAKTATNKHGEFSLSFEANDDSLVQLEVKDGRKRLFLSQPRRIQREMWFEWSDDGRPVPRPGFFEARESLIRAELKDSGLTLRDLDESPRRLQITMLAEAVGLPRTFVGAHALAARLEQRMDVPAAVLFAMVRPDFVAPAAVPALKPKHGSTSQSLSPFSQDQIDTFSKLAQKGELSSQIVELAEASLLARSPAWWRRALEDAVREGHISGSHLANFPAIEAKLRKARITFALSQPYRGGSPWTELLAAAGVPDNKITDVAQVLADVSSQDAAWRKLKKHLGAQTPVVRERMAVADVAGNQAAILEHLVRSRLGTRAALARLDEGEVTAKLARAVPNARERSALARKIIGRLDEELPGIRLLRRRRANLSDATTAFLKRRGNADFDVLSANLEVLARDGKFARSRKQNASVRAELLMHQRAARVARHAGLAQVLLEAGYQSAQKIALTARSDFVARMAGQIPEQAAERLYRRARAHHRATVSTYLRLNQQAAGPEMTTLASTSAAMTADDWKAVEGIPSWQYLFGTPDFCSCASCSSVTSPAAYFVDLLSWLQRSPGGQPTAYDVLLDKRPDLPRILLNCENTQTEVPYIDLVCELLEDAVRLRVHDEDPAAPGALDPADLPDRHRARQTRMSSEEIRAYPEHLDSVVYDQILSQSRVAMTLPFDASLQEVRAYLDHFQTSRLQLMGMFTGGPQPVSPRARAAECLGLNDSELTIITTANAGAAEQSAIWGFGAGDVPLEDFLKQLRPVTEDPKSDDELFALLAGRFVNPDGSAVALEAGVEDDLCRSTDRVVKNVSLGLLDRMHRFLRLYDRCRKRWLEEADDRADARFPRPWSIRELDYLLATVAGGVLDEDAIELLGGLRELQQSLQVPPDRVASLLADFTPRDIIAPEPEQEPSLYRTLFLLKTDAAGPPAVYQDPDANPTLVENESVRLSGALGISEADFALLVESLEHAKGDERQRLRDALGLSNADYDALFANNGPGLGGTNITLPVLSALYRRALLAEAAGVDLSVFAAVEGVHPGAVFENPAALLDFLDEVEAARARRLDATTIKVLCGDVPASAGVTAELEQALGDLVDETQAAITEATGAQASRQDAIDAIVQEGSWLAIVTSWLGIDVRSGALLLELNQDERALFATPPDAQALGVFSRAAAYLRALRVKPEDLGQTPEEVRGTCRSIGLVEAVTAPSWSALSRVVGWLSLADESSSAPSTLGHFLALVDGGASDDELADALADALREAAAGVPLTPVFALDFLTAYFDGAGNIDPAELKDPRFHRRLRQAAVAARRLGATAAALGSWARGWPTAAEAEAVRNAARGVTPERNWLETSAKIQDHLRTSRRDALVDFLLATAPDGEPTSRDDLYGRYLIDTEMADCMSTSRIIQASAAVQAFVQRCFFGDEDVFHGPGGADHEHWREWGFRSRYRVWEANRRIFLTPENFLNVGKRSSASPQFNAFMKTVLEKGPSRESAEAGLVGYLDGLAEVANLDYAALGGDLRSGKELHVVARARTTPAKHFYRKLRSGVWTPWELVDVGTPGRHLVLASEAGRVRLMWPTYSDHMDPTQDVPPATESDEPPDEARSVSYLSYAWVSREKKTWGAVETSSRVLVHSGRAKRAFVSSVASSGRSSTVTVFAQNPSNAGADSGTRPMLGSMEIARDVVTVKINPSRYGLSDSLGGEHQAHIDQTEWLEPIVCNLGQCQCTLYFENFLQPWPDLSFDENRMIGPPGTVSVHAPASAWAPVLTSDVKLMRGRAVVVTPCSSGLEQMGASSGAFEGPFVTYSTATFGVRAVAVADSQRSFLVLSSAGAEAVAPHLSLDPGALIAIPAYQPFLDELKTLAATRGLEGIFLPEVQEEPGAAPLNASPVQYVASYGMNDPSVELASAAEEFSFAAESPYGLYNLEFFYHSVMFVAEQLRTNGQYEKAQEFLHFVYRPFTSEPVDPARPRARYWVTKPFRQNQSPEDEDIRSIIRDGAYSGVNPYTIVEENPFDAHKVAEVRKTAYQRFTVMRYLDNLIAWGDSKYREGTGLGIRESVYEATAIYMLAKRILGERPVRLHRLGRRRDLAFEDVDDWGGGSNVLVDLESLVVDAGEETDEGLSNPAPALPLVSSDSAGNSVMEDAEGGPLRGLYFCVPPNERLLQYWDDIERRLYNLRHCLTLDGQPVRYPLTAPPIDPQALADAAGAGLSVADALALGGATLPPSKFRLLIEKAKAYAQEAANLGSQLLSALEKRDAETVAQLRSENELGVLKAARKVKEGQKEQAEADLASLERAWTTVDERRKYYASRERTNTLEDAAFGLSIAAGVLDTAGFVFDVLSGGLYMIPSFNVGVSGFGGSPNVTMSFGGQTIGSSVGKTAEGLTRTAGILDRAASLVSTQAGHTRRYEDWKHQEQQADLELKHLEQQIVAAKLRIKVADLELDAHDEERKAHDASDDLLKAKFTNEDLYDWHVDRANTLLRSTYEQALNVAQMCRSALAYEARPGAAVPAIAPTYWESAKHGLQAGEQLGKALRDLEIFSMRERPFEHTVSPEVPLSFIAPAALLELRSTGSCEFTLPAWWLARTRPHLRNRRIQALAVTVEGVSGPYVAMNATLSLKNHTKTLSSISLSTGIRDFGWDMRKRDEEYVPFEGANLDQDTQWMFGFPLGQQGPATDVDYRNISDVILHLQYSADEGGQGAPAGPQNPLAFIDLRQMASDAWSELVREGGAHKCTFDALRVLPSFLDGYQVDSVQSVVAFDKDGNDVGDRLNVNTAGNDVTIEPAANPPAPIEWDKVRRVLLVMKLG